jgi:amino acid adenylation domain-containing protein
MNPAALARIDEFNNTTTPFPCDFTLHALFERQVQCHAEQIAVICDHGSGWGVPSVTFEQLNAKANSLAHYLRAEGVGPGSIVALMMERSVEMMVGLLAVLKAGGAYLPLAMDTPAARREYMLEDAAVQILLVHGKTVPGVAFDGRIVDLGDPEVFLGSSENPAAAASPTDLAYVIYTSGSTGRPKGVMVEHRAVVNRLHWMQRAYPLQAGDVILQKTPYTFDVSVWELFWWAMQGAAVCFLRPAGERNPIMLVETIRKHRVSVLHFVPSLLSVFLDYLDGRASVVERLASVRQVFASGEALMPEHVRAFNRIWRRDGGLRLTNLYGPTEATVDVSYFDCPDGGAIKRIPIGRPIDNIRLYVINDGRHMPVGETGELCIAGVGLARGYLNDPARTAERFVANPANPDERIYRTGDLARWLSDGNIEYLGRDDQQVKIRGLRIELGEIESLIRTYPGVKNCVAIIKTYAESVKVIEAYLVAQSSVDAEQLKTHLRHHLPEYMIPRRIEAIDAIPLTSSGKADRRALMERATSWAENDRRDDRTESTTAITMQQPTG